MFFLRHIFVDLSIYKINELTKFFTRVLVARALTVRNLIHISCKFNVILHWVRPVKFYLSEYVQVVVIFFL